MLRAGVLLVIHAAHASSPNAVAWDAVRAELYRFVARRVPPPDTDDIVQESLLRIHRGLASVRRDGAIVGWMYQVTRNALADHLRAARHVEDLDDLDDTTARLLDDAIARFDDGGRRDDATPLARECPDDTAFQRLAACVAPFVAQLPHHYRDAVELVELRGLSQVEAAGRLGVPISTMKSRVQRGRAQLRELLELCCAIDLDARGHVVEVTPRGCRCGARAAAPSLLDM